MSVEILVAQGQAVASMVSFVTILVLGIIIDQYIVKDPHWSLFIILMSFFFGILVVFLELRAMIRQSPQGNTLSEAERKEKVARYVALLFDEDIPFDDELSDHEPQGPQH